jgi:hypothetical protein
MTSCSVNQLLSLGKSSEFGYSQCIETSCAHQWCIWAGTLG